MKMINKIKAVFRRLFRRFLIINHATWIFETRYGIKNYNISYYISYPHISTSGILKISPKELYIDADFLKDEYTLLNTPITESPHYKLMKLLLMNQDISNSDYMIRYVRGYLDWRDYQPGLPDLDKFILKFYQLKKEIESDLYSPIEVYQINKQYYVHDGKHRAALCAALNLDVKCVLIDSRAYTTGVWLYLFNLIASNYNYSKHQNFYKTL